MEMLVGNPGIGIFRGDISDITLRNLSKCTVASVASRRFNSCRILNFTAVIVGTTMKRTVTPLANLCFVLPFGIFEVMSYSGGVAVCRPSQ